MTKKNEQKQFRAIILGLALGLVGCFVFGSGISANNSPFFDNFEDYNLGDLNAQSDWGSCGGFTFDVVDTNVKTGLQSAYSRSRNQVGEDCATRSGTSTFSGNWKVWVYQKTEGSQNQCYTGNFIQIDPGQVAGLKLVAGDVCEIWDIKKNVYLADLIYDNWFSVEFDWDYNEIGDDTYRININDQGWTEPATTTIDADFGVDALRLVSGRKTINWFDDIGEATAVEKELSAWVNDPASGTTIDDVADEFEIGWEAWDFDWIYKDFFIYFAERSTGSVSKTIYFEPTTESGSKIFSYSEFEIDKNSVYDLAVRARSYLVDYTEYRTGNLLSPAFYVIVDVDGFETIFKMPDFQTWYSENVEKFATPTAVFAGVAEIFDPIFSSIGAFGNDVKTYLNAGEANELGFNLGKTIPMFRHYVKEIEKFFGGFPIITIFLIVLILLFVIFVVRLIFKFIPGLG